VVERLRPGDQAPPGGTALALGAFLDGIGIAAQCVANQSTASSISATRRKTESPNSRIDRGMYIFRYP